MSFHIAPGLPEPVRRQAAAIYWQAFGGKLGTVMGPTPKALVYLDRVIRADHSICALDDDGVLLGLAGFKTPNGAFADGTLRDLQAVYGLSGGLWRASVLWLLQREVDNARFLVDGICVARAARGRGVGTALIAAICDEARARGYPAVRLDVIDSNWRARALYERQGFVAIQTEAIGPLRHLFGFSAATTMVRDLD